jgi:glycosyltransferase involved in cell wall biosynthesis
MRVGVDATGVFPRGKGISRVQQHTVAALRARGEHDLVVFARHPRELGGAIEVRPKLTLSWEQIGLPRAFRRHRLDALLTWTERLPATGGTWVVWLFEVPLRRIRHNRETGASLYQRASDVVTQATWRRSLRRAAVVFTGSEATARELLELAPELEGRVRTLYPGVPDGFAPGEGREGTYVLHVGSSDPRDDTATALRAFALARPRLPAGTRLVVAGGLGGRRRELADAAGADVEFVGWVEDAELVALYRGAAAFLDVSLYEGFGYQVLEAMTCGAPVVATNVTSIPEITGDAAILCRAGDPEELADGLVRVLAEPETAAAMRAAGLARAATFTWERTAAEISAALSTLA